jgi:hypothetical protein
MSQPNDLSFLPDDYVARRARARANRLCGSLLLVTILSVAGAFTFAQNTLKALKAEHVSVNEQYRRESERLKRLDTLQKQQAELARRARLAEALIEKTPRTEVLASVKKEMPAGMSLVEVIMNSRVRPITKTPEEILAEKQSRATKTPGVVTEVKPKLYDVTMKVVGMAYTDMQVADYINSLAASPYFDEVNLLVSREVVFESQTVRRFEVEMVVRNEPKRTRESDATVATSQDQAAQ